jgi:hypothetical protein
VLGKPWAAFNINAPCYFLKNTGHTFDMSNKEWIVARITNITEHTADSSDPQSVEYGVTGGTTYRLLEVEDWRSHKHRTSKKRHIFGSSSTTSERHHNFGSSSTTTDQASSSTTLAGFGKAYNQ